MGRAGIGSMINFPGQFCIKQLSVIKCNKHLKMYRIVRHEKWHILGSYHLLPGDLWGGGDRVTATVRPKRLEPGLLYNTSLKSSRLMSAV